MGIFGTKRTEAAAQQPTPNTSAPAKPTEWTYETACKPYREDHSDTLPFPTRRFYFSKGNDFSEQDKVALTTLLGQIDPLVRSIKLTPDRYSCEFDRSNPEIRALTTIEIVDESGEVVAAYQLDSMRDYLNAADRPYLPEIFFITGSRTTFPNGTPLYTNLAFGDPDTSSGSPGHTYGERYRTQTFTQGFGTHVETQNFGTATETQTFGTQK